MKRKLFAVMFGSLMMVSSMMTTVVHAEGIDFSSYTDAEFLQLYEEVNQELVDRNIEKTATLPEGTYIGGKDVPTGRYVIKTTDDEESIFISLFSSEAYTENPNVDGDKYCEFTYDPLEAAITIDVDDVLIIRHQKVSLTVSAGITFE